MTDDKESTLLRAYGISRDRYEEPVLPPPPIPHPDDGIEGVYALLAISFSSGLVGLLIGWLVWG